MRPGARAWGLAEGLGEKKAQRGHGSFLPLGPAGLPMEEAGLAASRHTAHLLAGSLWLDGHFWGGAFQVTAREERAKDKGEGAR